MRAGPSAIGARLLIGRFVQCDAHRRHERIAQTHLWVDFFLVVIEDIEIESTEPETNMA